MKKSISLLALPMLLVLLSVPAVAAPCEGLAALKLPDTTITTAQAVAAGAFARVFTSHFYGHLLPDERRAFLAEARRVAGELVVADSARRPDGPAEDWQKRALNDGSRHRVYKRWFRGAELAAELGGGEVLLDAILEGQMAAQYFPVQTIKNMGAQIEMRAVVPAQPWQVAGATVRAHANPHGPTPALAYRIEPAAPLGPGLGHEKCGAHDRDDHDRHVDQEDPTP